MTLNSVGRRLEIAVPRTVLELIGEKVLTIESGGVGGDCTSAWTSDTRVP